MDERWRKQRSNITASDAGKDLGHADQGDEQPARSGAGLQPGRRGACLEIEQDPLQAYDYTAKGNLVAVISNGTAVLGPRQHRRRSPASR